MGSKIIFVDREDIRSVEAEEQYNFIITVLLSLGLPEHDVETCYPEDNEQLSVQHRIRLRKMCDAYQVSIINDMDGGIKIYVTSENEKTLVAEWKKPWFVIRVDPSELDRSKKTFAELHASWWTMFEDENE